MPGLLRFHDNRVGVRYTNVTGLNGETINTIVPASVSLNAAYPVASDGSDATAVTAGSGNVANASAVATIPAVAGKTVYITGFDIDSTGATAAAVVSPTMAGVISGTRTYTYATVAGATAANPTMSKRFNPPIPASAVNTAIVVTCPALGAGNTNATVNAYGFYA